MNVCHTLRLVEVARVLQTQSGKVESVAAVEVVNLLHLARLSWL